MKTFYGYIGNLNHLEFKLYSTLNHIFAHNRSGCSLWCDRMYNECEEFISIEDIETPID